MPGYYETHMDIQRRIERLEKFGEAYKPQETETLIESIEIMVMRFRGEWVLKFE